MELGAAFAVVGFSSSKLPFPFAGVQQFQLSLFLHRNSVMKHLLLTTIAALVLVGCGESQPPEPPDISISKAASTGNIEAVKQHLASGANVNTTDMIRRTPLHRAAEYDHMGIAKFLIANGADVNAKSDRGRTPLHDAARWVHMEIAELLIANGADVNATDELVGWTPLDEAINQKHTETVDLLRKHGSKTGEEIADEMAKRSIHVAARVGDIDWVIKHLESVTDVNAQDDDGWTPLHLPAGRGHKEIVELLIAAGADVNARDVDGSTPLDLAKLYEGDSPEDKAARMETADLLRKHGGKTGEELKAEGK